MPSQPRGRRDANRSSLASALPARPPRPEVSAGESFLSPPYHTAMPAGAGASAFGEEPGDAARAAVRQANGPATAAPGADGSLWCNASRGAQTLQRLPACEHTTTWPELGRRYASAPAAPCGTSGPDQLGPCASCTTELLSAATIQRNLLSASRPTAVSRVGEAAAPLRPPASPEAVGKTRDMASPTGLSAAAGVPVAAFKSAV
mmetsp:Transcript_7148/g.28811  ORF Transcript_7148/g.28811 Transcript_7148/m.28811 type:complete len:204 (-) Transcript_7148:182-793(-)